MNEYNSVLIDKNDNVVTTLKDVELGKQLNAIGLESNIVVSEKISKGFKVAIKNINKGETIMKYGKNVGIALFNIKVGDLVHIHNIRSNRGKELREENS